MTPVKWGHLPIVRKLLSAVDLFIKNQIIGGLILVACTVIALFWANGSYENSYKFISDLSIGIKFGNFDFSKSILHWINDGLMAVFFLLIGLEVKRELFIGELNSFKKAFLPVVAALFGMIFPAIIFFIVNFKHPENYAGWAIPTATDIAFALGVLSLFRSKIPKNLFLLLATIAIVDDMGAVLIISIFYTKHIDLYNLFLSLFFFGLLFIFNMFRIKKIAIYLICGVFLWYFLLKSGIHASISGVFLAATIPLRRISSGGDTSSSDASDSRSPLERLESVLHIPVNYLIVPLFILFNAGISFYDLPPMKGLDGFFSLIFNPLILGVFLGLFLGKPLGIVLVTFILNKCGWASLPKNITIKDVLFMGCLAGIGFTMAIFISDLAFSSHALMTNAKVGILLGSFLSILSGFFLFLILKK